LLSGVFVGVFSWVFAGVFCDAGVLIVKNID